MLTNTEELHGRKVPPHLFEYALKNTANMFRYFQAFEKVKNRDNPIASTFTNNWIYQTEFNLPGMLKWMEVVKKRILMPTFVGEDVVMWPHDPLGRGGLTLDQFLSF